MWHFCNSFLLTLLSYELESSNQKLSLAVGLCSWLPICLISSVLSRKWLCPKSQLWSPRENNSVPKRKLSMEQGAGRGAKGSASTASQSFRQKRDAYLRVSCRLFPRDREMERKNPCTAGTVYCSRVWERSCVKNKSNGSENQAAEHHYHTVNIKTAI